MWLRTSLNVLRRSDTGNIQALKQTLLRGCSMTASSSITLFNASIIQNCALQQLEVFAKSASCISRSVEKGSASPIALRSMVATIREEDAPGYGGSWQAISPSANAYESTSPEEALVKVLFCGVEFPAAFQFTQEAVKPFPHVMIDFCPREEVPDRISDFDMCVVRMAKLDDSVIARAQHLKLIIQYGVGLEGVDVPAATRRGIKVAKITSDGTGNALSCAEHALYLIFGLLRDQKAMAENVSLRILGEPVGETLYGKTVLIIGYGNISKELILRLSVFGVRILVISQFWDKEPSGAKPLSDQIIHEKGSRQDLHRFASRADVVFTCCTLTKETQGIVDAKLLASFKPGARLVNVARGGLLDYQAVKDALDSGHLGGLAMDVTWYEPFDPSDPIVQHPKVLLTPHIAGVTDISYRNMSKLVAECANQLHTGLGSIPGIQFVN